MLNFPSPEKILLLAIIALVVLGPSRLPGAARTAGKWIGELRKLTSRFQEEVAGTLAEPKDALTAAVGDLSKEVGTWRSEIADLGRSMTTLPTTNGTLPTDTGAAATSPAVTSTWSSTTIAGGVEASSGASASSVESTPGRAGLPVPPPAPDDPSLN